MSKVQLSLTRKKEAQAPIASEIEGELNKIRPDLIRTNSYEFDNGMYSIMSEAYYKLTKLFGKQILDIISEGECELDYLKASKDTDDFGIENFKALIGKILAYEADNLWWKGKETAIYLLLEVTSLKINALIYNIRQKNENEKSNKKPKKKDVYSALPGRRTQGGTSKRPAHK